jgi:hypothetical protein
MVPGSEFNDVGDMAAELVSELNLALLPVRELKMRCIFSGPRMRQEAFSGSESITT